jgi:DNA replication protein DnaC
MAKLEKMEVNMQTFNFELKQNEYLKDGMIYCKQCNEPKLYFFKEMGRYVRVACSCDQKEYEEEQKQKQQEKLMQRIKMLQSASLLDERYKSVTFNNTQLEGADETFKVAYNRCLKYCENYEEVLKNAYGIYLVGGTGTGKTHLTACMVNYLLEKSIPCIFTNFYEIVRLIRSTWGRNVQESEMIDKIINVPFLFIDDFGTERVLTNGNDNDMQDKIYEIINKRYNAKKPTVFTSNNTFKQLIEEKGLMKKTVDRLVEMCSAVMEVKGDSHRLKNREKNLPF